MPKSLLNNRLLKLRQKPFEEFQRIILQKHIDILKIEVRESFKITSGKRLEFHQAIPVQWKLRLLDYCYDKLRSVCRSVSVNHEKKLTLLIKDSDWNKHANPNFVVNLSDKPLSNDAKCALGYGLKFATSNQQLNFVDVAKGFCNLEKVSDIPAQDINICKGFVYSALATPSFPSCPKRFLIALSDLKKDKDLHITKADKSNCVVILNKVDYNEKMKTLLSDKDTYTKIHKNPLETVNSEFNKKLKGYLVGHTDLIKRLSTISPSLPYMYGLIKTHKTNNPVRPIICSIGYCSYK